MVTVINGRRQEGGWLELVGDYGGEAYCLSSGLTLSLIYALFNATAAMVEYREVGRHTLLRPVTVIIGLSRVGDIMNVTLHTHAHNIGHYVSLLMALGIIILHGLQATDIMSLRHERAHIVSYSDIGWGASINVGLRRLQTTVVAEECHHAVITSYVHGQVREWYRHNDDERYHYASRQWRIY